MDGRLRALDVARTLACEAAMMLGLAARFASEDPWRAGALLARARFKLMQAELLLL